MIAIYYLSWFIGAGSLVVFGPATLLCYIQNSCNADKNGEIF